MKVIMLTIGEVLLGILFPYCVGFFFLHIFFGTTEPDNIEVIGFWFIGGGILAAAYMAGYGLYKLTKFNTRLINR